MWRVVNPSPTNSSEKDPAEEARRLSLRGLARLLARVAAASDYSDLVGNEAEPCDRAHQELTHD